MTKFYFFRAVFFLTIFCTTFNGSLYSQTFSNNTLTTIADNSTTSVPIAVNGLSGSIDTVGFGIESVTLKITHSANSELTIWLQSPDGKTVLLAKDSGGSNFNNTTFNGTAAKYVDFSSAPYSNSYRSIQDLAYLNNFQNPNGIWNLVVKDGKPARVGTVQSVSIKFSAQPAKPLLSSSNLPIIIINTNGNEIVDDPKVTADMAIIYNGPGAYNYSNQTDYNYSGKIGIEFRGHSSQMFPKKQYGFETLNATGDDDIDVSLLGLPKESDWILSANYSDKTMMRNVLSYQLSREMGNYASRTIYCEVIVNNEYKGVFVLQEKIKRNKNRVNVEKLSTTDITAPNITGGYIFSIDKLDGGEITWHTQIPGSPTVFQFVYPKKVADLAPEQKQYLSDYVNSFEQTLNGSNYQDPINGFRKYADDISFMDFFIINELARNIDGYRISSYFHKGREGKLVAGPVWDFDIAWGNANYFNGNNPIGFQYSYTGIPSNDFQVPFWWARLMSDGVWKSTLACRFADFRNNILSQQRIYNIIDSLGNELKDAQVRNFTRWNIMGAYVWPNPSPIPLNYAAEVIYLKDWVEDRLNFLDGALGPCVALPITLLDFTGVPNQNINKLSWTTSYESNNEKFIIERSSNNQPFMQIGVVKGKGSSNSINKYLFDDINPQPGVNLYRLKQIDFNGNISYSKTISLGVKVGNWMIVPNLVDDQLIVLSPYNDNRKLQLNIFNMQGQLMESASLLNSTVINRNVSGLSKGSYVLTIVDSKGNSSSLKFIKR